MNVESILRFDEQRFKIRGRFDEIPHNNLNNVMRYLKSKVSLIRFYLVRKTSSPIFIYFN